MGLELLYPEGKTVKVAGETLTVTKFMFPQFAKASKLSKPIMLGLFGSGLFKVIPATKEKSAIPALNDENGNEVAPAVPAQPAKDVSIEFSDAWPLLLVDVLADCGDAVVAFCAFATGKPVEFFNNADLEEGLNLARAIFEVNWDFIKARILPNLGVEAAPQENRDGSTQLQSSSQQDTQEPTLTE